MAYDLEEQEQLDALKAWWAKYGTAVMAVVAAIAVGWGSWSAWKAYQGHRASQAMGYFEALEDAARLGGDDSIVRIKAAAGTLRDDFAKSPYTGRAVLVAADALLANKDADAAKEQLTWLSNQSQHAALQPLARVRLAGILLDQKKYDDALAQLASPPAAFEVLFADRRGDVLAAQGKTEEARQAWRSALDKLGPADPLKQVVQLKLDALTGV